MPIFKFCNENLTAITEGLDPKVEDVILAIGGSGDQSLALLAFGCKVFYIDSNRRQVEYFKKVVQTLEKENFHTFLNVPDNDPITHHFRKISRKEGKETIDYWQKRYKYFNDPARLKAIKKNIHNLEIIEKKPDILNFSSFTNIYFSKIYMSNIFTTMSNKGKYNFSTFSDDLYKICEMLDNNGLIYFSDGEVIRRRLKEKSYNSNFQNKFSLKTLGLKLDKERTKKARMYENFYSRTPLILAFNS